VRKDLYKDLEDKENTHWWHISKKSIAESLVNKYKGDKKIRILDVGCGSGFIIQTLQKHGNVWGVDIEKEAISICKQKKILQVKLAKAEKLPFKSASFDMITILDVLEHVDDKKALKELQRVLSKKGKLVISVPAYQWMWSKWDEILHHKRRYTKKTLRELLEENGFKIIKISYLYSFLLLPAFITRKIKELFSYDKYSSDFLISNSLINNIFGSLAKLEKIVFFKIGVPFGLSVIAVAQKKS